MAFILIHAAKPEESRVLLVGESFVTTRRVPFKNGKRGDVLKTIDALLASKKVSIKSLSGVVVISGPGHFSCLRGGISIANTLGFALGIPVVGVEAVEVSDKELIEKSAALLKKKKKFTPVVPMYGKEPNITISKFQSPNSK
ncbi:MAG: hypothetical protein AAB416_01130 [Patescibacteria group bacterium]